MSFALKTPSSPTSYESSGGRLVAIDGRALPLFGACLVADARGGLVRITLEQTFRNPHDEPLRVTYSLPLPADGAVSGFAFRIGDERVVGQVDLKQRARQRFEDAILEGRTAAILDQERSSLFTQEVGNVPPRTQVICEVQIDQRLTWLPDGAWEWRFPTVVAPRYLGAPGRVVDHAQISVEIADVALPVKLALSLAIRDRLPENSRPESPSHTLHTGRGQLGALQEEQTDVTFADERGAGLDRDVVVRWRVSGLTVGTELDVCRPSAGISSEACYGLLTLVPPSVDAKMAPLPRDLIVLLDTSGSMSGSPLDQARRVTSALVDSLTDQDQLELIEFSNSPRRWKHGSVSATQANRRDAQAWLSRLRASGGTEMKSGILEALAPLRDESQRQVVLITDGLIGSEHEVLQAISKSLPSGSRVHTVGVGSGVNRSLTLPAARAGRGVELVIGLGEDAEPFVQRLLARTNAPLLTDVEISGSAVLGCAPALIPDLFGGSPALVSLKLQPGGGELIIRARSATGEVEDRVMVRPASHGEGSQAIATRYAREVVEDLELGVATGGNKAELDREIERFGIDFQISTRLTSWVAVSARQMVSPRAPRRSETMPQALPFGMAAEGMGLRPAAATGRQGAMRASRSASAAPMAGIGHLEKRAAPRAQVVKEDFAEESFGEDKETPREDASDSSTLSRRATGSFLPAPASSRSVPQPSQEDSLVGMAKRFFQRSPGGGEAQKGKATRRLNGKVRRQSKRLIVEIDLTSALKWAPGSEARLELSDGSIVKALVVVAMTTAEGDYGLGLTITLVLEVDQRVAEPAMVHLSNAGEAIEIVL